ncbi:MAG: hypothetical protein A2428_03000 [Bdellovibrionales bacterium RIFOXYC1_FULL_54_43]|nr:MAG: hypothetical protein A2428_03000 [Bdellovibrionales bacterium RIFOXYC1_FULL_54_43]OFZ82649.1 MAG: hypothetical protein A2603_02435 [Bdellovibrionales bacterium RIFOXYD1_FULL_55_31]
MTLKEIKIRAIEDALIAANGNKTRAARELGVSIRWLTTWVRENPELWRFRNNRPRAGRAA